MRKMLLLSTLAVAALPATGQAAESYDNCTGYIDTIPAVIDTQGTWCLRQDVSMGLTSGSAIQVNTNNVIIDCNHFKIGGLAAGPGTLAWGVLVPSRLNTTIRNCNIRGFYYGVFASNGGGHLIEDNRLDGITARGIIITGDASTIRGNLVVDTGGTSVLGSLVGGIFAQGDGNDVLDNTIAGAVPAETDVSTYGIFFSSSSDGTVARNRIRGLNPTDGENTVGIRVTGGEAIVHDNILQGPATNSVSIGIQCASNSATARANVMVKFAVGVDTCLSSGNVVNTN